MIAGTVEALAIFGGTPSFSEQLHVGRPNVGDRRHLAERIAGALDRRWLTNGGPLVKEFEQRVASLTGVEHCVAVSNATTGLQLVARALDLSGEVIMPSFTFVGTAHAFNWLGLTPVFCDIERASHNLDPSAVEDAITPRTSAIVGVHLWGRPCDVGGLSEVAQAHGLRLVFDAAHALGCSHEGQPVGSFGDAEVFSFHATKVANAAEGGAITTSDASLAGRLRLMRNFGFSDYDTVLMQGTNAKMNELCAAMGLTSLESLDDFIAANRRNHACYAEELEDVAGIRVAEYGHGEQHNYHYVVVEVDHRTTGVARDDLVAVLHGENVLARRYFHPGSHRMPPYDGAGRSLPVTEEVSERVVALPTGTAVSPDEVRAVCRIVRLVAENGREVTTRLRALRAADNNAAP